jgi:hypothetical protein
MYNSRRISMQIFAIFLFSIFEFWTILDNFWTILPNPYKYVGQSNSWIFGSTIQFSDEPDVLKIFRNQFYKLQSKFEKQLKTLTLLQNFQFFWKIH